MTAEELAQLYWQKKFKVRLARAKSDAKAGKRDAGSKLHALKGDLAARRLTHRQWIGPRPEIFKYWSQ